MQLNDPQKRTLRYYLDHRYRPPTLGDFLRQFGLVLVLWSSIAGVSAWYLVHTGQRELAYLVIGVFAGAAGRESRRFHWGMRCWPAIAAVTDWKNVEALLSGSSELPDPAAREDQSSPLH